MLKNLCKPIKIHVNKLKTKLTILLLSLNFVLYLIKRKFLAKVKNMIKYEEKL